MKKVLTITATIVSYFAFATSAFAQTSVNPCANVNQFSGLCNLNANNLGGIVGAAVTFILIIAVLIALFFLIWGGISWITSGGDKAKVAAARSRITYAIIGLVVTLVAFFIVSVVGYIFNVPLVGIN